MPYGVFVRVKAPIESYDAAHAEILRSSDAQQVPGFVLHIGRATDEGFEIIEVWESKEQADAFNREVGWPAMQRAGMPEDGPEPEVVEFDPRAVLTGRPFEAATA
jgi:hypothetical protein